MKNFKVLSISLTLYILGICFLNETSCQNVTTVRSIMQNRVIQNKDRSSRDNKRLIINGNFDLENNSNKRTKNIDSSLSRSLRIKRPGRPSNLKENGRVIHERKGYVDFDDSFGQKKFKYHDDDQDGKQQVTGFEHYFTHPSSNDGKTFNQDDIDDVYLNGNHEYKKLIKNYNKQIIFHPESGSTYTGGDVSNIKGGNIFGTPGKGQKTLHSFTSISTFAKDLESDEDDYKTLVDYDKKPFGFSKSSGFESLKNSYGDLIGDGGGWRPEKNSDSVFKQDGSYGNSFGFKPMIPDSEKYYNLDTESFSTTETPFQSYSTSYPIKSYASKFNFDSRPFPDIEPTKYSTAYNLGKYSQKNTGFSSGYDTKANPSGSSSSSIELHENKGSNPDFEKAFYNLNKPSSNYGASFNFGDVRPSEASSASTNNFAYNKGYASTFDYQPSYGSQGLSTAASILKNYDFNKYSNYPSFQKDAHYPGPRPSVEIPHPIIIPVPHPYPVKVPIAKPVAVPILKEIKVPIEKVVPYPVIKNVPYPIEKRIPVRVEKQVTVPVPHPYPVKIPVIKNIYHHSHDHDIPSKFSNHHSQDKEPYYKQSQHESWDYEPEPQHSHRETWEDGHFNKNSYRENWEDDNNHKESPHNEHWEHEQKHKHSNRNNWEQNNHKIPQKDGWENDDRHKIPYRDHWEHDDRHNTPLRDHWAIDDHKNPHQENWEDEPRHKYQEHDSWDDKPRHRPSAHHSWDEEPKRRPSNPRPWQKPTTRKPSHHSTWEHESYKNSHHHRGRGRHRSHHRS